MKLICEQHDLAKGIAIVQRAVASRSTLPVLGNILLETGEGQLRLTATNLELAIDCWIAAEVQEDGAITVPARLFGSMVSKLAAGTVSLADEAKTVHLHLTSGTFKAKLAGIRADDFPKTPELSGERIELDAQLLSEMIEHVAFNASRDASRPNLTCIQVRFGRVLTMAATDGYRLGLRSCPLPEPASLGEVLVPATSMGELGRILASADLSKPVAVNVDEQRRIVFAVEGDEGFVRAELSAQLMAAKYPDYQAIIPKSSTTTVVVDNASLLRSLQMARLFANGEAQCITVSTQAKNGLHILADDGLGGCSEETLEADVKGANVTFSVDVRYLLDVVGRLGNTQLAIELTRHDRPMKLRPADALPDEFVHVVMPIFKK